MVGQPITAYVRGAHNIILIMSKICSHCGAEKPIDEFGKRSQNKDGISNICKECRRLACIASYLKHKDTIRKNAKTHKEKIQNYINKQKLCGCAVCGEKDISCLDFHHIDNKKFNISKAINRYSIKQIQEEIDKCVVLCANCHRKLHAGHIALPHDFRFDGGATNTV